MIYQTIVFAPLIGAIIAGFLGRQLGDKVSMTITTGLLFLSAILSWVAFVNVGFNHESTSVEVMRWMDIGDLKANWAFKIDTLTAVMLVVVTTVSALVHLYSWGYMDEDPSKPRFFAYLSLFTFAMLMLVTADNFIQMFFGWEGVGLASYLLIGFWYKNRPLMRRRSKHLSPTASAMSAWRWVLWRFSSSSVRSNLIRYLLRCMTIQSTSCRFSAWNLTRLN